MENIHARQVLPQPAEPAGLVPARPAAPGAGAAGLWLFAPAYVLVIAVAEVLVALVDPRRGVLLHALLLLVLLWHGARSAPIERRLYWSFAFAPLIRILSLSLPLSQFPVVWWYAIVSAPLVVAVAVAARAMGYRAGDLGLRWSWRQAPLHLAVGLLGVPLGLLEYRILLPTPLAPGLAWPAVLLPALILLLSTGFAEELIFRGLMQRAAGAALGAWAGPLLITALFAVLHTGYRSWLDLAFVFLAGGLFAFLANRQGAIWGVSLAHGLTNIVLLLVGPLWIGRPAP